MILRDLVRVRMSFPRPRLAVPRAGHRRRTARRSLAYGVAAFVAASAAMAVVLDSLRPEWRDPEYGHRLNQVRKWQAKAPHRPLVLVVGSSRAQMGVSPAAMGFPDEPDSPLPYNLAYRGASPCAAAFHLFRAIDAGQVPSAVLVEFCPAAMFAGGSPEALPKVWPGRVSPGDLTRLRELGAKGDGTPATPWTRPVWAAAASPWTTNRLTLMSHWLPDWVPLERHANLSTENMDRFGFHANEWPDPTPEQRRASLDGTRRSYERLLGRTHVNPITDKALAALVARCRGLGVPVAFFRIPESPEFRSWFTPASIAAGDRYAAELTRLYGVPVFPDLSGMREEEFLDGYHLLKHGAERYSRWLGDTHLKPWLASQGIGER